MNEDRKKLIAMYVALVGGTALYAVVSDALGIHDFSFERSLLYVFLAVTHSLYLVMYVTYRAVAPHTP